MHNLNVLLVKHVNNIVVFLGCVLLFDANARFGDECILLLRFDLSLLLIFSAT